MDGATATEMIGPFTPMLVCWASLIITVLGLLVGFFYTNITAFARRLRDGRTKAALGAAREER
jgi:hypothetical protein